MKMFAISIVTFLAIGLAYAAETGEGGDTKAVAVECHFAYRGNPEKGFEKETIVVEIPLQSGPVPEIARTKTKNHKFDDIEVKVLYDVNMLRVSATDVNTGREIWAQLYQLMPGLKNQFAGGHGFTGLGYIHHPTSDAQLQTWSAVAK